MKHQQIKSFETTIQIRFREADPAGIMFFGNIFSLAHDVFEEFIEGCGIGWKKWFIKPEHFVPIRHAECEYFVPFIPGEKYSVHVFVDSISTSTFKMKYEFAQHQATKKIVHAVVKMAHTFADKDKKIKKEIPIEIRRKLKEYVFTI